MGDRFWDPYTVNQYSFLDSSIYQSLEELQPKAIVHLHHNSYLGVYIHFSCSDASSMAIHASIFLSTS